MYTRQLKWRINSNPQVKFNIIGDLFHKEIMYNFIKLQFKSVVQRSCIKDAVRCEKDEGKGTIISRAYYVSGSGRMLYINSSLWERMWFSVKL